MEIEFDKDSGIITLKPRKIYPKGHDLEISFCDDNIVFTVKDKNVATNVQIPYDEWYQLKKIFELINR